VLGGYELLCRDHVAWLRARGHEVTVLATTYGVDRPAEERGAHGERVLRTLRFQWQDYELRRLQGAELWREERRQRRALERAIREVSPRVALIWHMAAVSKSLLAVLHRHGVPMVAVVGEPWPRWDIEPDAWLRRWRTPAFRWWKRVPKAVLRDLADRLVAPVSIDQALRSILPAYCSDHLRRDVERRVEAWRGRGRVVPNGIDLAPYAAVPDPERQLHQPLRLLYLGRVERRKGLLTAVQALPVLRDAGLDCRLDVVGWRDEAYAAEVDATARRLGVEARLDWRGPVAADAAPAVYAEHDVLLFPTIWEEPFGLVPLEAMAAGCLVVATGSGGSGEFLLDGETALRFPVEDAVALADRVMRLAGDPTLCARLRREGRRCAEAHTFERFAAGIDRAVADRLAEVTPSDG
jgi:glycogen synthase